MVQNPPFVFRVAVERDRLDASPGNFDQVAGWNHLAYFVVGAVDLVLDQLRDGRLELRDELPSFTASLFFKCCLLYTSDAADE